MHQPLWRDLSTSAGGLIDGVQGGPCCNSAQPCEAYEWAACARALFAAPLRGEAAGLDVEDDFPAAFPA